MDTGKSAWKVVGVALLLVHLALTGCAAETPASGKSLAALVALAPEGEDVLLATEVPAAPTAGEFEFVGIVESANAGTMTVDGHAMAVAPQTEIDPLLQIGDLVQVSGYVLADGSLLATEIQLAEQDAQTGKFEWSGQITSIDGATWVVGGMTITVDAALVPAEAAVGMWVKLEGILGADGQWTITSVEVEDADGEEMEDSSDDDEDEIEDEEEDDLDHEDEDDVEQHDASSDDEAETETD